MKNRTREWKLKNICAEEFQDRTSGSNNKMRSKMNQKVK